LQVKSKIGQTRQNVREVSEGKHTQARINMCISPLDATTVQELLSVGFGSAYPTDPGMADIDIDCSQLQLGFRADLDGVGRSSDIFSSSMSEAPSNNPNTPLFGPPSSLAYLSQLGTALSFGPPSLPSLGKTNGVDKTPLVPLFVPRASQLGTAHVLNQNDTARPGAAIIASDRAMTAAASTTKAKKKAAGLAARIEAKLKGEADKKLARAANAAARENARAAKAACRESARAERHSSIRQSKRTRSFQTPSSPRLNHYEQQRQKNIDMNNSTLEGMGFDDVKIFSKRSKKDAKLDPKNILSDRVGPVCLMLTLMDRVSLT